jgi:hypothetical protein
VSTAYTALFGVVIVYFAAARKYRPQTLDIDAESLVAKRAPEIGLPWSLLFLPALFILAGLSIPLGLLTIPFYRRRERAFRNRIRKLNRLMDWSDFKQVVAEGRGTAIVERYSIHGPFRWWWTSDDVYEMCPFLVVEWLDSDAESSRTNSEWCRKQYTSVGEGRALLIDGVPRRQVAFPESIMGQSNLKWLTVVPPENLSTPKR